MDSDRVANELQALRSSLDIVASKLDTLIFNFNMIHQSQVDQGVELNALKTQCALRSLKCPVLVAMRSEGVPTPTPVPGSNGGVP
jgi:hypothetical protein